MELELNQEEVLTGDGNVFAVMGRVKNAIRKAGATREEQKVYQDKCFTVGGYDAVLRHSMQTMSNHGIE